MYLTMITQARVKELFDYNPTTGELTRRVTVRAWAQAGSLAGTFDSQGYRQVGIDGRKYRAHRLVWLLVHGELPSSLIDHINGQRDDNRLSNLRLATNSDNQHNIGCKRHSRSGVKGVYWHKARQQWAAEIRINGHKTFLGLFPDVPSAAAALEAHRAATVPTFGRNI